MCFEPQFHLLQILCHDSHDYKYHSMPKPGNFYKHLNSVNIRCGLLTLIYKAGLTFSVTMCCHHSNINSKTI